MTTKYPIFGVYVNGSILNYTLEILDFKCICHSATANTIKF